MTDAQFEQQIFIATELFRRAAPYDTGNLSLNAIRLERVSPGEWRLFVDDKIAPYAVYTEEPWTSPKWGGKQNPNEGWIARYVEFIASHLASILGAENRRI